MDFPCTFTVEGSEIITQWTCCKFTDFFVSVVLNLFCAYVRIRPSTTVISTCPSPSWARGQQPLPVKKPSLHKPITLTIKLLYLVHYYVQSKSHEIGKSYNSILRLIRHLNIARIATPILWLFDAMEQVPQTRTSRSNWFSPTSTFAHSAARPTR